MPARATMTQSRRPRNGRSAKKIAAAQTAGTRATMHRARPARIAPRMRKATLSDVSPGAFPGPAPLAIAPPRSGSPPPSACDGRDAGEDLLHQSAHALGPGDGQVQVEQQAGDE